jgi:DNA polymerase III epsilon subunit-like protein
VGEQPGGTRRLQQVHAASQMIVTAIDTETTGFLGNRLMAGDLQPYMIQFCSVKVNLDTEEILDKYVTFIRPPRQDLLTEKIVEITRITWDDIKDTPMFGSVAHEIIGRIEEAETVVAHNLSFDRGVLDVEAARIKRAIKWPNMICSVEQTIYIKGIRLDLSSLHEILLGERFEDAHRADVDTMALVRCLIAMRRQDMI